MAFVFFDEIFWSPESEDTDCSSFDSNDSYSTDSELSDSDYSDSESHTYDELPSEISVDCVTIDLDGTLVHSDSKKRGRADLIVFKNIHGDDESLWVHKRPGFDIFLKRCFEIGDVGVWSMGQPNYVDAIIKLFPQRPKFVYNFRDCDRESGKIIKCLDNIPHTGKIVMVDDQIGRLKCCDRVDTIIVSEWRPHKVHDDTLYKLTERLTGRLTGRLSECSPEVKISQ